MDSRKTALVVLGMHRSGTSAMSRVLSLSGAALPARLAPAAHGNELGHWEAQDTTDLNERILAEMDSSWFDIFGPHRAGKARSSLLKYLDAAKQVVRDNWADEPVVVFKEPRVNLLLELWSRALKDEGYRPVYVIMVRHPLEVADSLKKRDGFIRNRTLMLWAKYMLAAEVGTRDAPRIFVRYDDLLTEPEDVLDRIESSLDVVLPRRSWLATTEIDRFLTADARHHNASGKTVGKTLPAIQDYYEYLENAALGAAANEDASAALRDWLATLEQVVGPIMASLERNIRDVHQMLDGQTALVTEANARLAATEASFAAHEQQLLQDLEEANGSLSTLRSEREEETARLAEAEASFAAREQQLLAEIEAANATLSDLRSQLEPENARILAELEAATASLSDLRSQLEPENARILAELEAATAESLRHQRASEAQAEETRQTREELEQVRRVFEDRISALESEREWDRKASADELEAARKAFAQRAQDVECERKLERDEAANKLKEARQSLEDARAEEATARRTLEMKIQALQSELQDAASISAREYQTLTQELDIQRKLSEDLSKALTDTIATLGNRRATPTTRLFEALKRLARGK